MRTKRVVVLPYDRTWKPDFEEIKKEIEGAVGDLIVGIEHVGSTSVEGMSAKPMYDIPSRKCSHMCDMKVTGKAKVHGIEGVELTAREASYSDKKEVINRTFVAQLTDTHCRYLATLRNDGDVRNYITFLDGDPRSILLPRNFCCRTDT